MRPNDDALALLRTAPVARIADDGRIDGDRLPDAGTYRMVREPDARALVSLTLRPRMKKPSSQISDIVTALPEDPHNLGTFQMTADERTRIIALCKAVDKRDQQLRKNAKLPAMTTKKAKRTATKAAARR